MERDFLCLLTELSTEEEVIPTAVVDGLLHHGWLIDWQEQVGILATRSMKDCDCGQSHF